MERSVTVRTPEAISFYYELAGLGSRFLALLIDTIVQAILFVLIFIAGVAAAQQTKFVAALHLSAKSLESLLFGLLVLVFFTVFYGYFVVFEALWRGQTPGKRLLGLRVVRDGGYPIELMNSIVRNLIRILEFFFGFYILSVISMLASPENKRLGDYAAGTIVVRDHSMEVRNPQAWRDAGSTGVEAAEDIAAKLDPRELAVVDLYVSRKTTLGPAAARETAAKIAALLRPKLGRELQALSDDELITRVAARKT